MVQSKQEIVVVLNPEERETLVEMLEQSLVDLHTEALRSDGFHFQEEIFRQEQAVRNLLKKF